MQSSVPSNLFSLGVDLFGEVQRVIGKEPVRGLRVKIGNRLLTEIRIAAAFHARQQWRWSWLAVIVSNPQALKLTMSRCIKPLCCLHFLFEFLFRHAFIPIFLRVRFPLFRTQSSDWSAAGDLSDRLRQSQLKYADMPDREIVSRAQRGENAAAEYLLYK